MGEVVYFYMYLFKPRSSHYGIRTRNVLVFKQMGVLCSPLLYTPRD